ncbi:MAG: glycosyltransferase family 2 protein [Ardenticatenales bacterium]|nr:glycosyltransferase family 2 protein [Ardenticatenales bacterium]
MTDAAARGSGIDAAVTAIVLTLDEEAHLPDCLRSLRWADRVVVVDSGSRDGTVAIARAAGADVVHHPFVNYARQRQFALGLADTRWVLFVDADERVSEALAAEVRAALSEAAHGALSDHAAAPFAGPPRSMSPAGFWIPRANEFWGRTLRGGGWWPDRQLRLLDARRARYDPDHGVHEVADLDGPAGVLEHPLRHLNYASWSEFDAKQRAYARLEVERRRATAWRWRPHQLITQPARAMWRRYVTLGGWRDGWLGARLALRMAWYEAVTVIGLRDP